MFLNTLRDRLAFVASPGGSRRDLFGQPPFPLQYPYGYGKTEHADVVLLQDYKAGERLFVDHAGDTIPVHDPATGVITPVYPFAAALGASKYTYAEAVLSGELPSWISLHVYAFEFMGFCSGDRGARQRSGRV
ncbi:MAG: hypothetical protein ABSC19_17910 [Syntrophorhabdales bacterium]